MNVRFWKKVVTDPIIVGGTILLACIPLGLLVPPQERAKGVPPPPRGRHYLMVPDEQEFPPGWKLSDGRWVPEDLPSPDHHYLIVREGWDCPPGWELRDGIWFSLETGNPVVPAFDE